MTKHLLICGSPRRGNTEFVLEKIFDGIDDSKELVLLREKNIKHCSGCLACDKSKTCSIRDDMDEINKKLLEAEVIVIGTPNYFDNVSGLLKDFIDRTNPFYETDKLKGKKLINIVVGGGEVEHSKKVSEQALKCFAVCHKLEIVDSYFFQATEVGEIERNEEARKEIDGIIEKINSL